MQFPITIGLHRSRFLDGALMVATMLATGITLALPYSANLQLPIVLLIVVFSHNAWRKLEPGLSGIRLERSGRILVSETGDTDFFEADLLQNATVHPWLTVVRFRDLNGSVYPLILAVDSMKSDNFRRLRVFLRWRAKFSPLIDDA